MLQDMGRNVLDVGRRRRVPTAALRRAVLERDGCRCQFPGCNSRRVDIHHIKSWADGGETKLSNLTVLCKFHHRIVHRKGYVITPSLGGWQFTRPDGALVDRCPCLPEPDGHISDCHDASISMDTIVPAWYGDKLDLDFTIWACFANARIAAERRHRTDADQPQHATEAA
jgi:HNH endonuclease